MYMKSHEHAHLQLVIFLIFFMPVTPLFPNLEFQISKYREMWRKWAVWERFWPIRVTYTRCWSWKWRIAIPRSSSLQSRAGSSATLFSTRLLAILASSFNSSTPGSATPYIYIYFYLVLQASHAVEDDTRVSHKSQSAHSNSFLSSYMWLWLAFCMWCKLTSII